MPPIQFKRLELREARLTMQTRSGVAVRNAPKRNVKQQCLQITSFELNTLTFQLNKFSW